MPTWLPSAGMEQLRRHAADTARNRRSVQAQVGPNAKRVIMAVVHGGAVPHVAHVDCRSWLHGPSRETRLIQWVACSDLRKFHDRFIQASRQRPGISTVAYWWVLQIWESEAAKATTRHLSLHLDGLIVRQDVAPWAVGISQLTCTCGQRLMGNDASLRSCCRDQR